MLFFWIFYSSKILRSRIHIKKYVFFAGTSHHTLAWKCITKTQPRPSITTQEPIMEKLGWVTRVWPTLTPELSHYYYSSCSTQKWLTQKALLLFNTICTWCWHVAGPSKLRLCISSLELSIWNNTFHTDLFCQGAHWLISPLLRNYNMRSPLAKQVSSIEIFTVCQRPNSIPHAVLLICLSSGMWIMQNYGSISGG